MIRRLKFLLPLWDNRKFINAGVNLSSYYFSRVFRKKIVWGRPFTFFLEPTTSCNLRCPECPVGMQTLRRPQGQMSFEEYRRIIDDICEHTWYLILYFQGESFINPDIIKMINYAYKKGIYTEISTNGTRLASSAFARELAGSRLGRLIVAIDGASEETYRIYRQEGHFQRVIRGVRQIVEARKRLGRLFPRIHIQFLVMKHNEHEMEAMKHLGKSLGVDRVVFKSPQIYNFEQADEILPQNPRFRRYEKVNGRYRLKGTYSGYCRKIWIGSVITWDRKVIPCCFDKDARFVLGNLAEDRFENIWKNSHYHQFRNGVVESRNRIEMCRNCSEGLQIFFRGR